MPLPPEERPVRNNTIPDTKRSRPSQSNVRMTSLTVTRLRGLSFKNTTSTAIANPPVLDQQHYGEI